MHIESYRALHAYEFMWESCIWLCESMRRCIHGSVCLCDNCVTVTMVIKCEWYIFDMVLKWRCEYLLYHVIIIWELLYLFNWLNENTYDCNIGRKWICVFVNPKYYVWVRIFFMLNVYVTFQWLFGRLHPCDVDMQVEETKSMWVVEDGERLLIFYAFGVLASRLWLGCQGF
jgi:hypothetical protein